MAKVGQKDVMKLRILFNEYMLTKMNGNIIKMSKYFL